MKSYKVGILGASGAVGQEMRKILAERDFPISELHLFASARSAGKVVSFKGQDIVVEEARTTRSRVSISFWARLKTTLPSALPPPL